MLADGVTGSEAALTGLGLLNTLFVVLAAGLWMSTVFRERRYAVPATLGLVGALIPQKNLQFTEIRDRSCDEEADRSRGLHRPGGPCGHRGDRLRRPLAPQMGQDFRAATLRKRAGAGFASTCRR